jgi:hypothetical protein
MEGILILQWANLIALTHSRDLGGNEIEKCLHAPYAFYVAVDYQIERKLQRRLRYCRAPRLSRLTVQVAE